MSASPATRRLSILVVDDYPDAAISLAAVLRLLGHDARAATDGEAAMDMFARWEPDVAILDLWMPGLDGFALAERLGAAARRPLLLAVTGSVLRADRQHAAAEFDGYFLKPADLGALTGVLDEYAARPAAGATPTTTAA